MKNVYRLKSVKLLISAFVRMATITLMAFTVSTPAIAVPQKPNGTDCEALLRDTSPTQTDAEADITRADTSPRNRTSGHQAKSPLFDY